MDKDDAIVHECLVYEGTSRWEVDEEVGIVDVLDRNAQLSYPRCGVVGRYGLASDRHNMGDPTFREDPRRFGGVNPGKPERVSPEVVKKGN